MSKHGKKYRGIREKRPEEAVELKEAIEFLKVNPAAAFDETVELMKLLIAGIRSRDTGGVEVFLDDIV